MQTVNVQGAWRADKTAQVCLWATLPEIGEVFVVSGQVITLPLTTEVTEAVMQGRLVVVADAVNKGTVADREVDAGASIKEAPVKRGRK